jgi:lipoate synthase
MLKLHDQNVCFKSTFLTLQSKIDLWTVLENTLPVAKPKWLKVKLPIGKKYTELKQLINIV